MASASAATAAPTETAPAIRATSRFSEYNILCDRVPKVPATAYDRMIIIKVTEGNTSKEFPVYRGVLCFHSEFFKRALSDRWQHDSASVYEITDRKIATFEMFFNWMNTDNLLVNEKLLCSSLQAAELHHFADFYVIPPLKNLAMEAYFHICFEKKSITAVAIESIYRYNTSSDLFRKLVVDLAVEFYPIGGVSFQDKQFGYEFLTDVILASQTHDSAPGRGRPSRKELKRKTMKRFCKLYHRHGVLDQKVTG